MTGQADDDFQALVDAWSGAIVADDPDAIGSFVEPDWVLVGASGAMPRDQFLDAVAAGRITHHTMRNEIHDVRRYGDIAVLLSRGTTTGAFDGHDFALDEWITEVFVRRPAGWKCIVTHLTNADDRPE